MNKRCYRPAIWLRGHVRDWYQANRCLSSIWQSILITDLYKYLCTVCVIINDFIIFIETNIDEINVIYCIVIINVL